MVLKQSESPDGFTSLFIKSTQLQDQLKIHLEMLKFNEFYKYIYKNLRLTF